MEINDVYITNWYEHTEDRGPGKVPGCHYWRQAEQQPDLPLIEAQIDFKLSWNEYQTLLSQRTNKPHANQARPKEQTPSGHDKVHRPLTHGA